MGTGLPQTTRELHMDAPSTRPLHLPCPAPRLALALLALASWASAAQPDWPQFHGPQRDARSAETGLLKRWPAAGPKLLWTARGIGHGFSSVAIAGELIYTTGNIGNDTVITALDLDGTARWQARNGPAYKRSYPGTRGTPTLDAGRLYHENADGDVVCLEAATGKPVWSINILKAFGGRNIRWALAESLLIDGDRLICTPGGKEAGIVALDKMTGKTLWVCPDTGDEPGYASPIVVDYKGIRQVITMMSRSVVGVHAETGRLLWKVKHAAAFNENIHTPVFHDGLVFVSTLPPTAAQCIRLTVAGDQVSAERLWRTGALNNHHGGVVLVDGYLYGSTTLGNWVCLDLKTGRKMHGARGVGKGSVVYADGMLITYSEKGRVGLVKATPEHHQVISQFRIPKGGKGPSWAHPVVCRGRLYLRHGDFLFCYDIRRQ